MYGQSHNESFESNGYFYSSADDISRNGSTSKFSTKNDATHQKTDKNENHQNKSIPYDENCDDLNTILQHKLTERSKKETDLKALNLEIQQIEEKLKHQQLTKSQN